MSAGFDRIRKISFFQKAHLNSTKIILILLGCYIISGWLGQTILIEKTSPYFNPWYTYVLKCFRYGLYLLFGLMMLLKLFFQEYNRRSIAVYITAGALIFLFSRSPEFLIAFLVVGTAAGTDFKKILCLYIFAQGFILLFIPLLSSFDIFPNYMFDAERLRQGLGFTWTTSAPILLIFLMFEIFCFKRNEVKKETVYFLALAVVFVFFLTNTRLAYLISLFFLSMMLLFHLNAGVLSFTKSRWFYYLLTASPFLLSAAAVLLAIFYDHSNPFLQTVNAALSGRLYNSWSAWHKYGLTLFGSHIIWSGQGINFSEKISYLFVDCSYLNILINYGLAGLAGVLYWLTRFSRDLWKRQDTVMMFTLFCLILFSFLEVRLLNPLYNAFLLTAGELLINRKEELMDTGLSQEPTENQA